MKKNFFLPNNQQYEYNEKVVLHFTVIIDYEKLVDIFNSIYEAFERNFLIIIDTCKISK